MSNELECNQLEFIKSIITHRECPVCYTHKLEIQINFTPDDKDETISIRCLDCNQEFMLISPSRQQLATIQDMNDPQDNSPCPTCLHQGSSYHLNFDPELSEAYLFSGCPNCGRTHEEYR
jgi:DNA-directed RNA polymerase subunit M/transcription elongation factor TFIIS